MRRGDRQIDEKEARAILDKGEYGILGMITPAGEPTSVPVNYGVSPSGDAISIHGAVEGTKADCLEANPNVSFCVVGDTRLLPGKFGTLYESAILPGVAREAAGEEKRMAPEGLLMKYSKDHLENGRRYAERAADRTRVFRITIASPTGKA